MTRNGTIAKINACPKWRTHFTQIVAHIWHVKAQNAHEAYVIEVCPCMQHLLIYLMDFWLYRNNSKVVLDKSYFRRYTKSTLWSFFRMRTLRSANDRRPLQKYTKCSRHSSVAGTKYMYMKIVLVRPVDISSARCLTSWPFISKVFAVTNASNLLTCF
jgi:hypothetical protein